MENIMMAIYCRAQENVQMGFLLWYISAGRVHGFSGFASIATPFCYYKYGVCVCAYFLIFLKKALLGFIRAFRRYLFYIRVYLWMDVTFGYVIQLLCSEFNFFQMKFKH